jgi:hypothetical protein
MSKEQPKGSRKSGARPPKPAGKRRVGRNPLEEIQKKLGPFRD